MAKKGTVERNKLVARRIKRDAVRRRALKDLIMNKKLPPEERFQAQIRLAKMARGGSKVRYRNRCALSGRPHGYLRKFKLSRIAMREVSSVGQVPGVTKSSW